MRPDTRTVEQLFGLDVHYVVPLYQRPYVWTEEHQWAPLWDDVAALLEHQEAAGGGEVWTHFLGAIVLDQETTAPGQSPRFVVIDGQQRLTTLQILIAATAKAMEAAGAPTSSQLMAQLAVNNPLKAKGPELLKVFPTNADRRAFAARMDPSGPPPGWADDPDNQIDEAFDFFQARATEYLTGGSTARPETQPSGQASFRSRFASCSRLSPSPSTLTTTLKSSSRRSMRAGRHSSH